jgi:hypothetical protein
MAAVYTDMPHLPGYGASLRFEDNFWSSSEAEHEQASYNYRTGLNVLYGKMQQGCVECDEILNFFRQRIAIEEMYANKLCELSETKLSPHGFNRDDGASLKRTFENIKQESAQLGACHRQLADNILKMVVHPLVRFIEEHRKQVRGGMEELDGTIKKFDKQVSKASVLEYTDIDDDDDDDVIF